MKTLTGRPKTLTVYRWLLNVIPMVVHSSSAGVNRPLWPYQVLTSISESIKNRDGVKHSTKLKVQNNLHCQN